MYDEFDLRPYLAALRRYWRHLAGFVLLSTLVTTALVFLLPARYEATAGMAIVRAVSDINLVPEFRTLSEEQVSPGRWTDVGSRRQALVDLAKSSTVVADVLGELGPKLGTPPPHPDDLRRRIKVEAQGDFILLTASARAPEHAAGLANVWARAYVRHVNEVYGELAASPEAVDAQTAATRAEYEAAQADLEAFLGDNRIDLLQREIAWRQSVVDDYYRTITDTLGQVSSLLVEARALQAQVNSADPAPAAVLGDQLAIIIFRAAAFTKAPALGAQLQINLDPQALGDASSDEQRRAIASLVSVLEDQQQALREIIERYSDAVLEESMAAPSSLPAPDAADVRRYAQEVLVLQSQLESERATWRQLTRARDIAWETYSTLQEKAAEIRVAAQFTNTAVRLASPAGEPRHAAWPRKKSTIGLAGALSLLAGLAVVLAGQYAALHVRH